MSNPNAQPPLVNTHLVKGEDLNHHQTLYAGRCVEWCVHAAYLSVESCFVDNRPLVFMSIRNLRMRRPVQVGEILQLTAQVAYVGESTIGVEVVGRRLHAGENQSLIVVGTFLFCTIDAAGRAVPHGLSPLLPASGSERSGWQENERAVESELESS